MSFPTYTKAPRINATTEGKDGPDLELGDENGKVIWSAL